MDMKGVLILALTFVGLYIPYCQAQCPEGEVSAINKCFEREEVARNRQMAWRWYYLINLPYTSEIESQLRDIVQDKFIDFSEGLKNHDLGRSFCPDAECSGLEIDISVLQSGERVRLVFYLENIPNLIREHPTLVSTTSLSNAVNGQNKFDLGEDNILGTSDGAATSYTLISDEEHCPDGSQKIVRDQYVTCGVCARGYYFNDETNECIQCEYGSYQEEPGQLACDQCTPPNSTLSLGSRSASDCQIVCLAGAYYDNDIQDCAPCSIGTFQPNRGREQCESCPTGHTTYTTGGTNDELCLDTCDAGYKLTADGACAICPHGTFLSNPFTDRECRSCPEGITTINEGSTSMNDCDAVICGAGEQREGISPGVCRLCPQNTYKSAEMQTCQSCGNANNWRTEGEGSTSVDQCTFYCPAGYYIDGKENCEACPHDTYKEETNYYATGCTPCPDSAPKTAGTASESSDDCEYARCDRGYQISDINPLECSICDYGYYQPHDEPIFFECEQCPEGTNTREQGAFSSTQCEEFCESGYERTVTDDCVPCHIGYYKDNTAGIEALFGSCQMCDINYITPSTASESAQDCTVRNCSFGYYRDADSNTCIQCELGSYQDALYQTSCKLCPAEFSTNGEGATSEAECSVAQERVRVFFRIRLNMEWDDRYFNPENNQYKILESRILAQVGHALQEGVPAYRENLKLRSLSPGSIDAHLVAQFYNPTLGSDLEQTLNDAVSNGQMSDQVVDGYQPLPIDERDPDPFAFGYAYRDFCARGEQYNYADGACELCPVGWYQMDTLIDVCLQCPQGYSTDGAGQTGDEQDVCLLICPAGEENRSGACRDCRRNYFKTTEGIAMCEQCPDSLITMTAGATTEDECIASCPAGEFSNSNKQCEECPVNTYNENSNQIECVDCPEFLVTDGAGATSISDCLDTCQTEEPCFNSGECNFNARDGTYTCDCVPPYTGQRCEQEITTTSTTTTTTETTTQTSTQSSTTVSSTPGTTPNGTAGETEKSVEPKENNDNLLYIAIGAAAGFIVIVIIIVAVICMRRRKPADPPPPPPKSSASLSKTPPPTKTENNNTELPMTGIDNHTYAPQSEDSFIVTTPTTPTHRHSNKGTTSSIPDMLAPEPPRSITTVNIGDGDDEIRHRSNAPISTGFDPIPDSFSMPTIRNPLLEDSNGAVFINGVATLPPPGTSWGDHPPPYTENATEPDRRGRKKKNKKHKNRKHVLIDTQRNMVHTFKSSHSDTSSTAYASPQAAAQNKPRPGIGHIDTVRSDGSGVYETIPGDI